ncbi:MAG: hypothetical protein ACLS3C_00790, partial [Oscillospiraceae bacterium]
STYGDVILKRLRDAGELFCDKHPLMLRCSCYPLFTQPFCAMLTVRSIRVSSSFVAGNVAATARTRDNALQNVLHERIDAHLGEAVEQRATRKMSAVTSCR